MTNPSLVTDGPKITTHYHIIPYYLTVWTAFHMANTWKMRRKKLAFLPGGDPDLLGWSWLILYTALHKQLEVSTNEGTPS